MERNLTSELSVDYLFFVVHLIVLFLLCDVSIFSYQLLSLSLFHLNSNSSRAVLTTASS